VKTLAILVGGGPAPGINAVISAATIEARNHGLRVLGCYDGFKWLVQGDTQHVVELQINDTSRIHFDGGSIIRTSRTNPARTPDGVKNVGDALKRLNVEHLITIGGDDTAYAASRLAKSVPGLTVAHVPKTIDNDLPLPGDIVTFGFTTACNLGKELVRNLMQDAATTERWFFVTVMGRHAGHLALGIGGSAAATLTLIAEEFPEPQISLDRVADTLEAAIIKRRAQGREHGVAILSEGISEKLDPATLGEVERDAYGNVRLAEFDLGSVLKERVTQSLKSREGPRLRAALRAAGRARHPVLPEPGLLGDAVPPGGRQQRHGDHPGRPAGADSLRPDARPEDGQGARPLRRHRVRDVPDARRLHDPAEARGPRPAGGSRHAGQGRQPQRDGDAGAVRFPRRTPLSLTSPGSIDSP
jgi:6-phosphofructokinase